MQGIYAITHTESGRSYVGSSVAISKRWYAHRWQLNSGRHRNQRLQRSWARHGSEAFTFSVLEEVLNTALIVTREQYHLDSRQPNVFNSGVVAFPPMLGLKRPHSEATKQKIGDIHRGKPKSAAHCAALSAAHMGEKQTPERVAHRAAMLRGRKNPHRSDEWRAKQRMARLGKPMAMETRQKIRDTHKSIQHSSQWNANVSLGLVKAWAARKAQVA